MLESSPGIEPSPPERANAGASPGGWARHGLIATAGLLALLCLFFLPALTTSDQFLSRDSGMLHHPTKRWVAARWARGEIPAWNPLSGLGIPEIAGAVDAPLHPFNALLVLLPYEAGFKAWVLLSFVAAALGTLAWARLLGCGWPAAFAGAAAFALSGHLVGSSDNLQYLTTLAFVPSVLAAAQAFVRRPAPLPLALTALLSATCAAGGDPQAWGTAILLTAVLPPLVAHDTAVPLLRRLARAAAAAGAAVAGAAPLWLPVALWLPLSSRAAALDYARLAHWDLLPRRLAELVVPNLLRVEPGAMVSKAWDVLGGGMPAGLPWVAAIYFGVTTLLLAAAGAFLERRARPLLAGAAAATWMSCGAHLGFAQVASGLPLLGSFRYWEKMFIWPTLLVCVAAALGLQALVSRDSRTRVRFSIAAVAAGIVLLSLRAAGGAWPTTLLHLVLPRPAASPAGADELLRNLLDGLLTSGLAALFLGTVAWASTRAWLGRFAPALLLAAAAAVDPFLANGHAYVLAPARLGAIPAPLAVALRARGPLPRVHTPFEIPRDRWPERSDLESYFTWGARSLYSSWNIEQRIGNLAPYMGMPPRNLSALLERAGPQDSVARSAGIWSVEAMVVPAAPLWAKMVGVDPQREVLASDPELPAFLLSLPHRPRAYLAEEVRAAAGGQAVAETLAQDPASRRCVIEGTVPPGFAPPAGSVAIGADRPEQVVLDVTADRQALVVLNDQHAPGWKAFVDGRPAEIVLTNLLARGVWVSAGRHRVEFLYRTPGLLPGLALALGLFAGLAGWMILLRRAPGCRAVGRARVHPLC